MRLIRSASEMAKVSARLQREDRRIGVVPTMGALHDGHLSLIRRAVSQNGIVIVTVFVNPLQFGPREDFRRYPSNLPRDLGLCRNADADIVFAPLPREIYPPGFQTSVEIGSLGQRWEGRFRPGHFRGVATVVTILFELTRPTNAYIGQKDYQQALIIRRLVQDFWLPIRVHVLPTVREPDGLAMSSRNAYLRPAHRRQAAVIPRALREAHRRIHQGERRSAAIVHTMRRLIHSEPDLRIDYLAVADPETLEPTTRIRGRVVLLAAVRVGATRLIDNLLVDVP